MTYEDFKKNENQKQTISAMRDILRFCARGDVGTYYQQQSAKEMLINSRKIVWSNHNSGGTYKEEYKKKKI